MNGAGEVKALKTGHYVNVPKQTVLLKLSLSVEVPLAMVKDCLRHRHYLVDIAGVKLREMERKR